MSVDSDIEVRAWQPGDERALVELFRRCFGREISLAHWDWKLRSVSTDYENVWVATYRDRLIAQYAGFPVSAWVDGQCRPAVAIFDVMVDPAMRRQGVLVQLASRAHDCWREAGVYFAYGLPNEQWGSRTQALGIRPSFSLRWLLRMVHPERLLARRTGVAGFRRLAPVGALARRLLGMARPEKEIVVEQIHEVHCDLDAIAKCAARSDGVQLARGSLWVDRRYLSCPDVDYHVLLAKRAGNPVGYAVYSLRNPARYQAVIAEVTTGADDYAAYGTLINAIEQRCSESDVETIRVLVAPGTANYRRLRQFGFLPRRAEFRFQSIALRPEMQRATDRGEWHFEGGDFDVV